MVNPNSEDAEEKPLDPAVARVQARLLRLMLIAGLTLGIGVLAVFLAIIYRIATIPDKSPVASVPEAVEATASVPAAALPPLPADAPATPAMASAPEVAREAMRLAEATVPADARLVASTVAGGHIVLTYDHFAGTIVITVDPETLAVVGRLDIRPQQ